MSTIIKFASMLSQLDQLGFKNAAKKLANNNGLKMLCQAEGLRSVDMIDQIKESFKKDLLESLPKYKLGLFKRADPTSLTEEELSQIEEPARYFQKLPESGIAGLEFLLRSVPEIHSR